jgi:hypothetical protein
MDNRYFVVSKLDFINHSGLKISILSLFNSIDIYESVYEQAVTAELVIKTDGVDPSSLVRAIGGEMIKITFKYPKDIGENEMDLDFIIIEPSNTTTLGSFYVTNLKLVSPAFIANKMATVTKSYTSTCSDTAKKIFDEYIIANIQKLPYDIDPPELQLFDTTGVQKTAFSNNKPIDAIQYLCTLSKTAQDNCDFIFFQTLQKFFFVSIREYLKKQPVFGKYTQHPEYIADSLSVDGSRDLAVDPTRILDYRVDSTFNFMDAVSKGVVANRTVSVNYYTQQITDEVKKYDDANKEFTDDTPAFDSDFPFDAFSDTKTNVIYTKLQNDVLNDPDHSKNIHSNEFTGIRNMQIRSQLDGTIITIKIPGTKFLNPGKIIEVVLMKQHASEKQNILNGKYLVTSVKHAYGSDEGTYYTHVTCVKDSFSGDN